MEKAPYATDDHQFKKLRLEMDKLSGLKQDRPGTVTLVLLSVDINP
jgi:hypothetical protein